MNGRLNNRDRLFVRLAKDGTAIANSAIWRKQIPRGSGRWKDITEAVLGCCSTTVPTQKSYILFQNTTAAANITSISFPGFGWSGTLANGQSLIVELPLNMTETVTIITSAFSGRTLTTSTIQGAGVIPAIGALSAVTTTVVIPSTEESQYKIVLS